MSTVRLAYNPGPVNAYGALRGPTTRRAYHPEGGRTLSELGPTVRVATTIDGGGATGPKQFERHLAAPSVRLALVNSPPERNGSLEAPASRLALSGVHSQDKQSAMADPATLPALLVSYFYLKPFEANRHKYHFRDWVMDSGAFSAHASGSPIDLSAYMEKCKELLATDPQLVEIYALDVIGDWRASLKNTETMWAQGISAIPCYHRGEPEDVLKGLARDYPKIALGGAVGVKIQAKNAWASQCFARVWPKPIHGFGFGAEQSLMALPFHSVDATNWEAGPCRFGRWQAFGQMSVRGSKQNLRAEVEWYLDLEQRARVKWRKQMEQLSTDGPTLRLAEISTGRILNAL